MRRTKNPKIYTPEVVVVKKGWPAKVYNPKMANRILFLSKLGLTQAETARALEISSKTLDNWLRDRSDIREAYEKGKFIHDHGVQDRLLQRAMGYEYEEVKYVEGTDSIGRSYKHKTTTMKVVLPDTTAQIFWLKNRHRGEWSDVQHHNINSSIDVNMNNTLKLDTLSDQEREMVQNIALKQLSGTSGIKR